MKKLFYILLLLGIGFSPFYAQDVHFSQYDHNPIFQNPANIGRYKGDYRFHLNYRNQWNSITVPFQTFSVSAEAKQVFKNLNVGLYLFHDVAGDGKFRTLEVMPAVSYTLKLTPDSTHILTPALQFGLNSRSLHSDAFTFDNQWNGYKFDPSLPTHELFDTESKTNLNWGVGVGYQYQQDKRHKIIGGFGIFNINRPNQGFFGDVVKRDLRFNLFGRATFPIGFEWDIIPSLQFNIQGKYRELIIGSQVRYILVDRLGVYRALLGGIYMRSRDAFYISLGMEYQNWWAGISYDINYSKLTPASRARGGFEISVRYILELFQPRNIKHRVCPDYI